MDSQTVQAVAESLVAMLAIDAFALLMVLTAAYPTLRSLCLHISDAFSAARRESATKTADMQPRANTPSTSSMAASMVPHQGSGDDPQQTSAQNPENAASSTASDLRTIRLAVSPKLLESCVLLLVLAPMLPVPLIAMTIMGRLPTSVPTAHSMICAAFIHGLLLAAIWCGLRTLLRRTLCVKEIP